MTMPAIQKATVDDLIALGDDGRYELIDGQIVPREAARFEHSDAQGGLASWTRSLFQRKPEGTTGGWWIGTEVEVSYESGECYIHDLAGWRRSRVPDKPSGRPVPIVPDWVCEILSPANWRNDTVVKFDVCFRHQVGCYWIVDVEHRVLTVYRWHPQGWLRLMAVEPGQRARLEPFEAVEFEVAVLFGDDPGPEPAKIVG
ncbi:MAG: Uma2 family endonuclease [Polyangiaceae bacterium]|nr:Uma2 family endonuclease [Polyangiaceae bacterium]